MHKLRLIKERTSERTASHEQDLRDLGGTSLLKNSSVEPYLAFKTPPVHKEHQFKKILQNFTSVKTHFCCSGELTFLTNNSHTNYKVNSVILFNIALQLNYKKVVTSMSLNETNWLQQELKSAIDRTTTDHNNLKIEHSEIEGMHISALHTHVLSQAGYNMKAHLNSVTLNDHEVSDLVKHLIAPQQTNVRKLSAS